MDSNSEFSLPLVRDTFFNGSNKLEGHYTINFGTCHVCNNSKISLEYRKLENSRTLNFKPVCFECIFTHCGNVSDEICRNCAHYGFLDTNKKWRNGEGLCMDCYDSDIGTVDFNKIKKLISHFGCEQYVDNIMSLLFSKTKSSRTQIVS